MRGRGSYTASGASETGKTWMSSCEQYTCILLTTVTPLSLKFDCTIVFFSYVLVDHVHPILCIIML